MPHLNKDALIELLALKKHEEGGYYNETYRSPEMIQTGRENNNGLRTLSTCIYYLLTDDSPIGYFHKNLSPILHFYHSGAPLTYRFIYPDGKIEEHILGPDILSGHKLQLIAPGEVWKSTELSSGESYGLVSEVVLPGWEIYDTEIAQYHELLARYPQHETWVKHYSYGGQP
ncbi:cupin [Brenneria alni]|uniref:Cupin n=1 Tax=Brenneria alni TaxID=71656 RepID=A0A421DMM0_9GAMM|nr:cupin domain-containing protein [Brenneria alni]RLM22669.1 cupin [Brenneria alni]